MERRISRRWIGVTGAAALGIVAIALFAGAESEKKQDSSLMRKKLAHAQNILEGLALENYDEIKENAKALDAISRLDQWMKIKTPAYTQLSSEFRSAVAKMATMADEKNLEGATMNFMQVTASCVECHKLIRGGKLVTSLK